MKRIIVVLLVGSSLALAACGGDGGASAPDSAGAATPAPAAPAPSGGGQAVAIKDFAFAPDTIQAKVGEKVTWTNDDSAAHTATAKSGADFDSGDLAQGASFSFTPQKAGTIAYFCSIHPNMLGTIEVSE